MDNLCHSLLGAALGRAGLTRGTPAGTFTLLVASNLPDVDAAVFATHTLPVSFRRGWTHGVLALALLPVVFSLAVRWWKKDARLHQLLLLSYTGVLTHVFLDFLNSYGVRLLMPFSDRWFYGDALYIVDPWMYLLLGGGWWLARSRERRRLPHAQRPARIGVALAAAYVLAMLGSNLVARAEVTTQLARAGRPADTRFMVTPVVANPLRREVLIDVGDRYEKGLVWFEPRPHFRPAGFGVDKAFTEPEAAAVLDAPTVKAYLRWSRFPFFLVDRTVSPPKVVLNDYRYSGTGREGWAGLSVVVPAR